ncbi:MAG: N-acetyltransferase [Actinobacteria bacterium]|nr:N-acetyltransferase [Actinomycetota bacterium]
MNYSIRQATAGDRPSILSVVRAAFSDGEEEVRLVENVWARPEYLADLELVAERDGAIIGHVLLHRGYVEDRSVAALAPLCVHPKEQGKGIGTGLLNEAITRTNSQGHPLIVLLGHPEFYERLGFKPASGLGINTDIKLRPGPDPFLALPLEDYDPSIRGMFRYCWD